MREYLRRDYSECGHDRPMKFCRRDDEPKTFWALFGFYLLVVIFIPVGLMHALSNPPEGPTQNAGPSPPAEAPDV